MLGTICLVPVISTYHWLKGLIKQNGTDGTGFSNLGSSISSIMLAVLVMGVYNNFWSSYSSMDSNFSIVSKIYARHTNVAHLLFAFVNCSNGIFKKIHVRYFCSYCALLLVFIFSRFFKSVSMYCINRSSYIVIP